MPTAAGGDKVR
ncbi:hypothetical protein LINPERHAP1_LOCUS12245 [Linum perenne]